MCRTILILGGYGQAGLRIARLLRDHSDVDLVLAGRNGTRAEAAARELGGDRARGVAVDASDADALRAALEGTDLLVVASSTLDLVKRVAGVALEAGVDYLDTQLSSPDKLAVLRAMQAKIEKAGRVFVTDGGFHPGIPAAMVRWVAGHVETLEKAMVGGAIRLDWRPLQISPATRDEFAEELTHYSMELYRDGAWRKVSYKDGCVWDLGAPFGKQRMVPMALEEMRDLPKMLPGLRETGFVIAGFDPLTDYVVMPLVLGGFKLRLSRERMARLLMWSLRRGSRPPFGTMVQLRGSGTDEDGRSVDVRASISHEDGYDLTAIPVAACMLQLLDGAIAPGLHLQAQCVEPERFFADMSRLGATVTCDLGT